MSGYGSAKADANPQLSSCFVVELDRIRVCAFEVCKVGQKEWSVGQTRTGLDPLELQTFSGLRRPTTIHLEKTLRVGGLADLKQLIEWGDAGSADHRSGSITLLDREGKDVFTIEFTNGWVSLCDVPQFDARNENQEAVFLFDISVSGYRYKF